MDYLGSLKSLYRAVVVHTWQSIPLLLASLLLAACAGPRYQTLHVYQAPTDAAGRSCAALCAENLKDCRDDCVQDYANCIQTLEPEARARHADALKRFEGELAQYRRDLDSYHLNLSLGWGYYDDGWFGSGWHDPWRPYGHGSRYYPPQPPRAPRYEDTLERLRSTTCRRDCGCQPLHDACILDCGGTRVLQRRCSAGCPPAP